MYGWVRVRRQEEARETFPRLRADSRYIDQAQSRCSTTVGLLLRPISCLVCKEDDATHTTATIGPHRPTRRIPQPASCIGTQPSPSLA